MNQVAVIHSAFEDSPRTVALVDVEDRTDFMALEYAFRVTQNIQGSWSRGPSLVFEGKEMPNEDYNENITVMAELPVGSNGKVMGLRSTSVNDQMLLGNKKFRVGYAGFEELV